MYCGGCFRDNALVAALRQRGHDTLMVPLYLPLNLEEVDQSAGTPIFYSGLNVYLEQRFPFFRKAPRWFNRLLASPLLLKRIGRAAAKTRPADVGELALSMLRGEEGNQARELRELIAWLKSQPQPDVICLSNVLLIGMARQLKAQLKASVVCTFQGEDGFLDALPAEQRPASWQLLRDRAGDVDLFLAPSQYYRDLMRKRLNLPSDRVRLLYNGINLAGFGPAKSPPANPTLGFFARMCHEKGLDTLVEAFLILKQRHRVANLKLRIGGSLGPADEPLVQRLKERLQRNGAMRDTEFCPNLDRSAKQDFYRSLSVLSVPANYGEAFGLYVIEALATEVPVALPRIGAFPELVAATGGGVLFEPKRANAIADVVEPLLLDPDKARALGQTGRKVVLEQFSIDRMADDLVQLYQKLGHRKPALMVVT